MSTLKITCRFIENQPNIIQILRCFRRPSDEKLGETVQQPNSIPSHIPKQQPAPKTINIKTPDPKIRTSEPNSQNQPAAKLKQIQEIVK